jgi:AcrR family transcriptional regulator
MCVAKRGLTPTSLHGSCNIDRVARVSETATVRVDGRLARSERARAAVIDAVLALLTEGDLRPTAPRIAERAGVSLRSSFHHFPDMETLFRAVGDRQVARVMSTVHPIAGDGPLADRIAAFVAQRAHVYEMVAPVRRAALLNEPFSAEVAQGMTFARKLERAEIEHVFATELEAAGARGDLLEALVATGSWPYWEDLRAHQRLSLARARKTWAYVFGALLAGTR